MEMDGGRSRYACGLLTFQAVTGVPCVQTAYPDGTAREGYFRAAPAVYVYHGAAPGKYKDYLDYVASEGIEIHHGTAEDDFSIYEFIFDDASGQRWFFNINYEEEGVTVFLMTDPGRPR